MSYELDLTRTKEKALWSLGEDFQGTSAEGGEISFTNYYMMENGKPFFGVSGEFHFSRMPDARWEDELIKMKMGGINVVSTYVFWIHHEEEEGVFNFAGCRNLRRFVELCGKHGLYVILRVGPFDHGEVRNGGLPDWLYGKPFEVRKLSDGFLFYTRRLYTKVGEQVEGLFFKDNGPIIGVQIDNEYMHSSAPWELTAGVSDEWVFRGDEGNTYMLRLRELAAECGLVPAFYTCTGWGGAATPDGMLPLWGGYAFRPWIFYSHKGEHPATEEYVYQDFHNNDVVCTNDFKPAYRPEEKPYVCCEMGGGMFCCYYYRFQYPYKSVDAMANIKIGSGCNFLGYYMFHGGSNPVGKYGAFMNEGQVPKISYDFQAALGEFGQVRESYRRLKSIHYFVNCFGERLCGLGTVLPEGASNLDPRDDKTLRYAVRTDGKSGFLFVNNYQDHAAMSDKKEEEVTLRLKDGEINWKISIAAEENAILPFHFDLDGIDLINATAQPVLRTTAGGEPTYVFFTPDGMQAEFWFEEGVLINGNPADRYLGKQDAEAEIFSLVKNGKKRNILILNRELANQMFLLRDGGLLFSEDVILEDDSGIRLETEKAFNVLKSYPADLINGKAGVQRKENTGALGRYTIETKERMVEVKTQKTGEGRYIVSLPEGFMEGLKDARLQLDYSGDIGHAFLGNRMINDNFANGAVWEIGLKDFAQELSEESLVVYITPLKEGVNVNVESAMAARVEEVEKYTAKLKRTTVQPVYEIRLGQTTGILM